MVTNINNNNSTSTTEARTSKSRSVKTPSIAEVWAQVEELRRASDIDTRRFPFLFNVFGRSDTQFIGHDPRSRIFGFLSPEDRLNLCYACKEGCELYRNDGGMFVVILCLLSLVSTNISFFLLHICIPLANSGNVMSRRGPAVASTTIATATTATATTTTITTTTTTEYYL